MVWFAHLVFGGEDGGIRADIKQNMYKHMKMKCIFAELKVSSQVQK